VTILANAADKASNAARLRALKTRLRALVLPVLGAVAAILAVFVIIKVVPPWLASTQGITDAVQRAEQLGTARTAVLAVLGGGLAVIGAVYTGLR
jgi:hypothetical protein